MTRLSHRLPGPVDLGDAGGSRRRVGAGTLNSVVGAGTLITSPVLLAVGYPAVLAIAVVLVLLAAGGRVRAEWA